MRLQLQRDERCEKGTTGSLLVDDEPFCVTLEPADSVFGAAHPCIPVGAYRVEIGYSPRFQRQMPHIVDVPGREGILIHWGNYVENTEGCVLVGSSKTTRPDGGLAVWNSRSTFNNLYQKIQTAQIEGVSLTIYCPQAPDAAHQSQT